MAADAPTRSEEESPIDDIAYLARSDHRIPTLIALTERPRSRSELCELAGMSSSTIRRTLGEFEDRSWIRKEGYQYSATRLGTAIASGMEELLDRVETERKLRVVWDWLPAAVTEFAIETGAETTVAVAEYDAPYRPVNRFKSLLRSADRFRFVGADVGLYEPCTDVFRTRILGGMQAEIIDPPSVAEYMLRTYPERCAELLDSGNFSVRIHDDLPRYGVCLFDDRVAISGYDLDTGGVKVLVDTDSPAARDWAESAYAAYETEAQPLDRHRLTA